eukprot:jgi/Ulvmu1/11172/UM072_0008.1
MVKLVRFLMKLTNETSELGCLEEDVDAAGVGAEVVADDLVFDQADVLASRSTRCSDRDTSSKWAALSFFENDPQRIKHHLNILQAVDNQEMLDSIARRAQREQRQTAVQDRIRYDFGIRQLQNTIKGTSAGQRTRQPGALSSVYTLCRTGTASAGDHTSARRQTSPAVSTQQEASDAASPPVAAHERTVSPQTVLPSAAWALQNSAQAPAVGDSTPAAPPLGKRGTPKVGLSTWAWGGASATLAAVAGTPVHILPPPHAPLVPQRPQTARPFRVRTRMDVELQRDMQKQQRQRRASSAHPSRRAQRPEQDLLELDCFQQRLDYWRARHRSPTLRPVGTDAPAQAVEGPDTSPSGETQPG